MNLPRNALALTDTDGYAPYGYPTDDMLPTLSMPQYSPTINALYSMFGYTGGHRMPTVPTNQNALNFGLNVANTAVAAPNLTYPERSPPATRPGVLAPFYNAADEATERVRGFVQDVTAPRPRSEGLPPVGVRGGWLAELLATGSTETAAALGRVLSAPYDYVTGRHVDASLEDAAIAGLSVLGPATAVARRNRLAPFAEQLESNSDLPWPASVVPSQATAPMAQTVGPVTMRGYRGSVSDNKSFSARSKRSRVFASDNPDVASTYADTDYSDHANIMPLEMRFQNALALEAQERAPRWSQLPIQDVDGQVRYTSTDDLAEIARRRGHDGLVLRNIIDTNGEDIPSTIAVALRRGTTYSPITGELLYGLAPVAAAAPVAANYWLSGRPDQPDVTAQRGRQ